MEACARSELAPSVPGTVKYADPWFTVDGNPRAEVEFRQLETLWFNTGTLCNLACQGCYIESSPTNDRLQYLTLDEVEAYLDEIRASGDPTDEIGFTGGEPFMNPDLVSMVKTCLDRGFRVLLLTNAMRPMAKQENALAELGGHENLRIRVSLDHYGREQHERVRGARSWEPAMRGLRWLHDHGFYLAIACRIEHEPEGTMREGFAALFEEQNLAIDAFDPLQLVLFPAMDPSVSVPEITRSCWTSLGVDPDSMMCARSRMVLRRKGAERATVVPCPLLPYGKLHELGTSLADARQSVVLNHPFCAQFCVLGGASCSATGA